MSFSAPYSLFVSFLSASEGTGVIVEYNHSSSVLSQCFLHHLARLYATPVNGAMEKFHALDDAMLIVQQQHTKHLMPMLGI